VDDAERDIRERYPAWSAADITAAATAQRRVNPDAFAV
jgi:hypothetical protein